MSLDLYQRRKVLHLMQDMSSASYLYGWYAAKHDIQVQDAKRREKKVWDEMHEFLAAMEEAYAERT